MSYRSLALAVTALTSMHVTGAEAQSVYVAPGGVYIGAGPVYVVPAPNGYHNGNGATPYVAPTYGYGYEYGPPAVVAPVPPPTVAPTKYYGPKEYYYGPPPLSVYGAELPPRPPVAVPYHDRGYVNGRYGYGPRWQTPY